MAKKSFDSMNVNAMYTDLERSTGERRRQPEPTQEEIQQRQSSGRTQGRKGCGQHRINLAFTPENYDFIQIVSVVSGQTMTEFINHIIDKYREERSDIYEHAKELRNML